VRLEMTVASPVILIFMVIAVVWVEVDVDAEVDASACMVAPLRSTVNMGLVGGVVYSYRQPLSRNG
jgi:hypothetical protein